MKIAVITTAFNEAAILPHFFNYYSRFCDKIILFDDSSTDNTVKIAHSNNNCSVVPILSSSFHKNTDRFNEFFKTLIDYDFVINVDTEEFLYNENLLEVLEKAKENGETIFSVDGYEMFSEITLTESKLITEQIKTGVAAPEYGKNVIFNPTAITAINYTPGQHKCNPKGVIKYSGTKLKLLHFKYIHPISYMNWRNSLYRKKLNLKGTWYSEHQTRCILENLKVKSRLII